MMRPLRKRHLQVWTAWAVLIPAGIVFAWLAIPDMVPVKLLQAPAAGLLPVIKKTSDKKDYTINLRTDPGNTQWQLEWKNKSVLMVPSAVIYKASPNPSGGGALESFRPENAILVGRIEARGDYVFSLQQDSTGYNQLHFILYDFIHQKAIEYINF
ncbi:MAG: hypothetical protein Q8941_20330 [Bacteroidota bacterium]|nr:hypothetical protein [Bacteroidota bacterium]